jgi:peptidoglycan/xylan/chitin deacetylase (PgdA/CDA1 family)/SAM-dependent methyltransferase
MLRLVEILISACFYYSGLVKLALWWTRRSWQRLVILCYHRASGGDLRRHLLYLRRHYRLLHLEAALEELYMAHKSERRMRDRRPPLVLTFDDGNRDNYTHGFRLASELQVPITMFLIPDYIESRRRFWWLEGDHLVSHASVDEAIVEGRTYHLDNAGERKALIQTIDTRIRRATSISEREAFLTSVRLALAVPSSEITEEEEQDTTTLTWAEVQEMEKSGYTSFGAHTMHHPILAFLTDPAEIQYEVSECREVLERQFGHPVRTFAYPVGHHEHIGENGLRAVQKAGYNWAVTALPGFNTPQTDPFLLRRVVVDVDQHWLSVAAKASGIWGSFSHLYWKFITLIRRFKMIALHSSQQVLHTLATDKGLKGKRRTLEQLREQYEIEKELASRLRESSREERSSFYASLYDEFFQRVPHHPQLIQKLSPQEMSKMVSHQLHFLRRFLHKDSVFSEIGAGDCALSLTVAHLTKKVYAVEVSEEITKSLTCPQNFELLLFDGCHVPLPANSVNVAYSHQLMEHLHPDDALEQLENIYRTLACGGIYICITPNRLSGPHDVSRHFDVVASGFHLKEYTNTELSNLFKQVGFSKVRAYVGAPEVYFRFPLFLLKILESLLDRLPHWLSKRIASLSLLNIRLVGTK